MKLILIDDMPDPLGRLATELAKPARIEGLSIEEIILVWPSAQEQPSERLHLAIEHQLKSKKMLKQPLIQPKSKEELAKSIKDLAGSIGDGSCMLVSDLNMDDIQLSAGNSNGNWLDPEGVVPNAIKEFLQSRSHYALFHSGQGINAEKVASLMESARAFHSRKAFDTLTSGEVGVADEIERVLRKTPLERIWEHQDTQHWFGGSQIIDHNFIARKSAAYWEAVYKVMGEVFPNDAYTASLHQSLKALAGTCFAGSSRGNIKYPLRLGSIALIAFIALYSARSAGDADGTTPDLAAFWNQMPESLAKRDFLKNEDPTTNRRVAVGLYWAFYNLFDKQHDKALESIEVMRDGFRLIFSWKTKLLFDSLMSKIATVPHEENEPEEADDYPKPENTTAALLSVQRWLGFSPGCIVRLSSEYSIDILSPSPKGLSTRSEVP
ncbi:MAG: hypothetical protein H7A55_08125 [Verrucomicrobiaceae bacterium]|nr:hypothetical protein [Verrucomicrobiaceae bacterium]